MHRSGKAEHTRTECCRVKPAAVYRYEREPPFPHSVITSIDDETPDPIDPDKLFVYLPGPFRTAGINPCSPGILFRRSGRLARTNHPNAVLLARSARILLVLHARFPPKEMMRCVGWSGLVDGIALRPARGVFRPTVGRED